MHNSVSKGRELDVENSAMGQTWFSRQGFICNECRRHSNSIYNGWFLIQLFEELI